MPISETEKAEQRANMVSKEALAAVARLRDTAPKYSQTGLTASQSLDGGDWSAGRPSRERRVMEALWGLDIGKGQVGPGFDALVGEIPRLEQEAKEDRENA